MTSKFKQPGKTMTWTNGTGSDVAVNSVVVVENMLCVATVDIADGDEGELATEGVFELPAVSAAVITQGQFVIWDVSAGAFDDDQATPATGDVSSAAVAWADSGNGETTVQVKLLGPGTVT